MSMKTFTDGMQWLVCAGFLWLATSVNGQIVVGPGDDLAAIALSAGAGDVIELAAGTHELSAPLVFGSSGVTLRGVGDGSTRLIFADTVNFEGRETALVDLTGRQNITLSNLKLDGQNNAVGAQVGVLARNASGHTLDNLTVSNLANPGTFAPIGVFFDGGVDDSVIRDNRFSDIGIDNTFGSGIRVHGDSDRNLIQDNTIDRTGRGGIFALGNNNNSSDFGLTFLEDLTVRNNTVTNSALSGGPDLGIELQNDIRGAVIEDNTVDRRISLDNTQQIAVRRNTVTQANNDRLTTEVGFLGLELVDSQDVVFDSNAVLGDVQLGISISGNGDTRRALFSNNLIDQALTFGVQVQGRDDADAQGVAEDLFFINNEITNTLGGPEAIFGGPGDGFRFNMAFDQITLDGNTIQDNTGEALFLNAAPTDSAVTLSDNNIDGGITDVGDNLVTADPPLTQEVFSAALGETVTLTFDDLAEPITHVLWDLGVGAPLITASPTFDLSAELLGDSRVVLALAFDQSGLADTAVLQVIPEPGTAALLGLGGLAGITLRPSRKSTPAPSSP